MKSTDTPEHENGTASAPSHGRAGTCTGSSTTKHGAQFMAVLDSRKRRIPGLYARNGRFYGLLWADRGHGRKAARRFPLVDQNTKQAVANLTEAKEALDRLRGERRENTLPQAGRKPGFDAFVDEYKAFASTQQKRKATRSKESDALARWKAHLANVRIDRITTPMIKAFQEKRLHGCQLGGKTYEPASARTVSLDFIALRNVLKAAVETGHLRELPRFPKLKAPEPARRPLLTPIEFDNLLSCCFAKKDDGEPLTKNGEQLRDFLRFLAYSGAREQEALRVRWSHVDFEARRIFVGADEDFTAAAITIGAGGTSKNRGSRVVDFNSQLESLLREMKERRAPDSSWLFPSPQRGEKDIPAKTLRESFELVREAAKLPRVGFHDLRHLFCSFCVMAHIDFMTIAEWLGHKDGGILIGKVYGHLLDEHRRKMAAKVTIGIALVAAPERGAGATG